jgi:wobble nucleotide-excising tRNase
MITKFKTIKNLAVFQNFDWDTSLRDKGNNVILFKNLNIIYGRNYSGKTTLSRIIRSLETGKISDKYENPDFRISFKDEADVTHSNLNENSKKIRVFNEDFVRDNLKFIVNPDDSIVPFAILGGNNQIEEEITALKAELGTKEEGKETGLYADLKNAIAKVKTATANHQTATGKLDNQLSKKATDREIGIKYKPERFGDQNYSKPKIEADIKTVIKASFKSITNEKQLELEKLLGEKTNDSIRSITSVNLKFIEFTEQVETLITKKIGASDKIEELVKDAVLNRWAKEGRLLHKDKLKDCVFCGNLIDKDRWTELDNHFDEESEILEKEIDSLIKQIEDEKKAILLGFKPNKNLFYSKFHSKVERLVELYKKTSLQYNNQLDSLKEQLESRKNDLINPKKYKIPFNYSKRLNSVWSIFNRVKDESNNYSDLLSEDQTNAKISLRLREVYDFATTIKYIEERESIKGLKTQLDDDIKKKTNISKGIKDKEDLIEAKRRLLNDEEKGALKVNEYLNGFFGHNFLSLQAIGHNELADGKKKVKFEIIRDGKKAHHLSEGECSLIAFCYFMAKLDDIDTKGSKPIIWIDDPISSLDGNHIFFVYSLINAEIVSKDLFEQLFISTHNLDFLKYLKRLPGALTKKEADFFIIKREEKNSKIKLMPKYLKDYVTEFNYLFHQIYKCSIADTEEDSEHHLYYNFGNNTRKFLEAFLFYKYPNAIENDDKLGRFFDDNKQASSMTDRINNEYSHLEGIFERSMIPVDIPEMKKTAQYILRRIEKKDKEQYDSLLKSIGVEVETEA